MEEVYKEYLQRGVTLDDLKARLEELTDDNNKKRKQFSELTLCLEHEQETLKSLTQHLTTELDKLSRGCDERNANRIKIEDEIKEIQEKHKTEMDQLERDKQAVIDRESDDVQLKKSNLTHKESILADKKRLENEIVELERALAQEKKERFTEVSDKEREKIRATENLKENMKEKIDETKANLKALNDEQLQTTTRLTILQNHQLTTELEYQSKQTEKLLNKNNKMQDQISSLKRDIELHKEIESELAKKFHSSQKKIKKLNEEVKKLDERMADMQARGKCYTPVILDRQRRRERQNGQR